MGRIVNELQVLADSEHPDFVRPEPIDLTPFTHELVAKASALAPRRMGAGRVPPRASSRRTGGRLTEAVMNLANNAVAHTEPDDTIAIGSSLEDGTLRLWVRDTGTGIPLADQARIFDRFQRGTGAHRRYRGSGLGLAIVKAIAEAHGGRVDLVSRVGVGSTFTLVIPTHRGAGRMSRILIAEDDPLIGSFLAKGLQGRRFQHAPRGRRRGGRGVLPDRRVRPRSSSTWGCPARRASRSCARSAAKGSWSRCSS